MSYRLSVAGGVTRMTRRDFSSLCDQAVDLADRGYTAVLVDTAATHRGLEVRRRNGVFEIIEFNHNPLSANKPGWLATAYQRIEANINRRTKL